MTYPEALSFLARVRGMWMKLGLERVQQLADALGNPEKRLRFVHVAGTNGKGSTCAFAASILQEAGYRVGLLTSPHLVSPRERIQVNGELISREALAEGAGVIKRLMESGKADAETTFFELITGLALWHFEQQKVDYVVWETGLGGTLDATNIVQPEVCAIPTIGFDHMHKLGETLSAIASQKAGILKARAPLVTSVEQPEAFEVLQVRARELGCPVVRIGPDWPAEDLGITGGRQRARLNGKEYALGLLGAHQAHNAACAVASVEQLKLAKINPDAISRGLERAQWPGRFQKLQENPPLVLDGAHNLEGARAAIQTWRACYGAQRYHLGFAVVEDKPVAEMIRVLAEGATGVTLMPMRSSRAAEPESLRSHFGALPVQIASSVTDGWTQLQEKAKHGPVLIAGSLFLAGEILACVRGQMDEWMENEWMAPEPRVRIPAAPTG